MSAESRRRWDRRELIVAFNLYCKTPFGKLHKGNPEIVGLARRLGRTPSALAMKLVNFASLDPVQQARQIKGLSNTSQADREIWDEFHSNWEGLAHESEIAMQDIGAPHADDDGTGEKTSGAASQTERVSETRVRLVQSFFRRSVLASYNFRCAICSIEIPSLLVASHIIPWSVNVERRADPTNGLSLCALHDRAFDRGVIAIDDSYRILLSKSIDREAESRVHQVALSDFEGCPLIMPARFAPDASALKYHRNNIYAPT